MKKPCVQCPFNKKAQLTAENGLGGSHPTVYMGQAHAPFWLPCHMDGKYAGKDSNPKEVNVCIGAAMFRSKLSVKNRFPVSDLIPIMEDTKDFTFDSPTDFLAHYLEISEEKADKLADNSHIAEYVKIEFQKLKQKNILWQK